MNRKEVLIIFAKNPVLGKVKTRLGATIGNEKALAVYKELLAYTYSVTHKINVDRIVFYADHIAENDVWNNEYQKAKQHGNDLGERMMNAFSDVFQRGYSKAVIIGTDCPMVTEEIITEAFKQLDRNDMVIGPASDGGYYLAALKTLHAELFQNIAWSTNIVLQKTIAICAEKRLTYYILPELTDIDDENDLMETKFEHAAL